MRLVASDVPAAALGAALTSELAKRAPGIDLIFHPWHVGDEVARLERGEVDLVVAVTSFFGASLRAEPLGAYPYAVFMRNDHPAAAGTLDVDGWLALPHIVVSGRGDPRGSLDAVLTRLGRSRRVAVVAPTFLHALELLCHSDLVGAFPTGIMAGAAAIQLTSRAVPVAIEPVALHLVRHRRTDTDAAVTLVAALIGEIAPRLGS